MDVIRAQLGEATMSPKRLRFEAMLFRSDSVRFEPCSAFHSGPDAPVCSCGWLEEDHAVARASVSPIRIRRKAVRIPERQAS
jgi:hypothetical protein